MNKIVNILNKFLNFLYALFFTRDDDLDMLQVLFTLIIVVSLAVIWQISTADVNADVVKVEGLVTLRWLAGLLVITAVPKWLVPFVTPHAKEIKPQKRNRRPEYSEYSEYNDHNTDCSN